MLSIEFLGSEFAAFEPCRLILRPYQKATRLFDSLSRSEYFTLQGNVLFVRHYLLGTY
jgi:hypothetical protein